MTHPTPLFSDAEHERIAAAIRNAESATSGEIFAVAARASDGYRFIPLLWAALVTLIGGTLAAFLWPLLAGLLADDADRVVVRADRAVRSQPEEHRADDIGGLGLE